MTTDLVLDDVTLIRDGNALVDGLDVVAASGQVLIVTGASGAGKTTLLKAILDLSPCDHGPVTRLERQLARVFQEPRLLPWYSTHRNVVPVIGGGTPDLITQQRLIRINFQQVTHLYLRQLSGGMRQWIVIARIMVTNPTLLPADEPFPALDKPLVTALWTGLIQLLME